MQKTAAHEKPEPPKRSLLRLLPVAMFFCLAALFAFALRSGDPSRLPSTLIGKAAPRLELPPLEGLTVGDRAVPGLTAATLTGGKPTIVNFWASWCAPCVAEHPLLVRLAADTGVTLIGINHKDQAANARRFLGRYGNPFKAVGVDSNGRAAIEWGVYGMPETFVLDGQGRIVFKHIGPMTEDTLAAKLLPAIRAAGGAK